jgi:hypothetical protein
MGKMSMIRSPPDVVLLHPPEAADHFAIAAVADSISGFSAIVEVLSHAP